MNTIVPYNVMGTSAGVLVCSTREEKEELRKNLKV